MKQTNDRKENQVKFTRVIAYAEQNDIIFSLTRYNFGSKTSKNEMTCQRNVPVYRQLNKANNQTWHGVLFE